MMILAMVSMSVAPDTEPQSSIAPESNLSMVSVQVQSSSNSVVNDTAGETVSKKRRTQVGKKDVIIIFHQDQYMDIHLQPFSITNLPDDQRYVLALAPNLPFDVVLAARAKISASNLIITELNQAWLKRLAL